jgi:hypothetical protein
MSYWFHLRKSYDHKPQNSDRTLQNFRHERSPLRMSSALQTHMLQEATRHRGKHAHGLVVDGQ